ncbi:hypothetical protein TNCV_4072231 [Trichonephila clavipes]|uniref:Uncharacterized protein n=1 Tax=Trichonephila clavipes TaxID=2585209 RepID=A0A8X7BFZ5_TRICX|nr:hypothetical protein TNCV_4072231 [Trichonephila clavipes]
MKASSNFSPGEDSTRITLSGTFRLITEKNTTIFLRCPRLMFSASQYLFEIVKESARRDAEHKGQSLQDGRRLFVWKFFFRHNNKVMNKLRSRYPSFCTSCQVANLCGCRFSEATLADLPDNSTTCLEFIP